MTAKLLGNLRPQINRFQLGAFEVCTILDGGQVRDSVSPPFGINQPSDVFAAQASANFLPNDRFENTFTPTIVNTGGQLILFDTGNGAGRREAGAGFLRERLALAGYSPEDVDIVAFTHVHPDHIGGLREADGLAFPNARYVIGRREYDMWSQGDKIPERRAQNRSLFLKLIPPLAEQMTFLEPGDDIVTGVQAIAAFGHSVGHLAYLIESEGKSLLIWGDVTNHYAFSLQRPDWHVAIDDDREQAVATRKRILDMLATDKMLAIGHHMPFPAVGYVEQRDGHYRWVPASYQLRL